MSGNPSWNPEQYLRFGDERLRPAIDLIARLTLPAARRVADLGCGAGNALPLLAARFPGAQVLGVDGSAAMLAKARENGFETQQADLAKWAPDAPFDLIFSNAALHWLPAHETLFPRLLRALAPGGMLAVQIPAMHAAPLRALQDGLAASSRWATQLGQIRSAPPILEAGAYYDLLRPLTRSLDLWFTEYLHVLRGEEPVVQWAMGSSLRPYLDALPEAERPAFLHDYAEALRPHYPRQADGSVLLPFRRFFLTAVV
ncbi:methyltransferase domain-containing protein [Pseudoroseomonas cervicalis]|uniref:Methyltransferase domain protein n=1 Tax=Pseudoroseomonas cervicalis ATCC 49957 TaxID=525371 RepID=D5RQB8_9PROT|nr:methyltransferase domain-containing protein [Pseudoroseomonas cervicalis]EFH10488.1 methyltransferase domain protein [Pseudoroseomonas cervicalis ATCC 49957]